MGGSIPDGVVTSLDVARFIAVPEGDPLPALNDGDVVLRYSIAGTAYFEDFSALAAGVPTGFTPRWDATATWTIEADATATGGKVLRYATAGGGRQMLSWDALDTDADRATVEVLIKWKPITTNEVGGIAVRASGDNATETGYRAGGAGAINMSVTKYQAGAYTILNETTRQASLAGAWHFTRIRVEGDTQSAKIWRATEAEPAQWMVTASDTGITDPGWVGFASTQAGTIDFDWIAAGTGGRKAVGV